MGKRKNYYLILGVEAEATLEEIKSSYRRLARQFHPDMQNTSDIERFREIQEAYEVLSDREKRRAYDLTAGAEVPIIYGSSSYGAVSAPFSEVWPEPMPTTRRTRPRPRRTRPRGAETEIILSPEEARRGGILSFEVPIDEICSACEGTGEGFMVWCWDCDGTGELRRYRRVRFSIPPGVEHGETLTAALGPGQGVLRARVLISQFR